MGGEIRFAYRSVAGADGLPVILIHGSPGESEVFLKFMEEFEGRRRLIAPDLPGFGKSSSDLPDYSFRSHATYLWELLDRLGVQKAHLVGFSLGGGVALHMGRTHPERVASITMLSAIGVQEMELLGDYGVNHSIHGAQLAGLKVLQLGIPRFGSWKEGDMGVAYARNFYDSDQRPLRKMLQDYAGPMLILHGEKDPLVPIEAAREHARLVPQSELYVFPSDHFMTFMNPAPLLPPLRAFLNRVEAGSAVRRASASADRVAQAALPLDTTNWPKPGFITLIVIFFCLALATLITEDLACIAGGVLVAEGRVDFLFATAACLAGILGGDLLLFLLGRWIGRPAVKHAPPRWFLREESLDKASAWLARNGAAVIFISRFTPGTRLPTYVAAGILKMPFWKFAGYFATACAIWTPILVGISAGLGGPLVRSSMGGVPLWVKLVPGGFALLLMVRLGLAASTYRGRRALVGRWRRLTQWEFWPAWAAYPPVVAYCVWLAIRYRGVTLFANANPGMPAAGGVMGESKSEILGRLSGPGNEGAPAFTLLEAGSLDERVAAAEAFRGRYALEFPIVLKPDAGQRGYGVAVIRNTGALREYLQRFGGPTILQEHAPGVEYGIFYVRYPNEPRGRIFSITEKRMPVLTGDGIRTVEELILADSRAIALAAHYLRVNEHQSARVPAAGERVQLVEIGTHSLGSMFLDGIAERTPALEDAVDRIAKTFDGFYFGRFDIRVASAADLREGGNLKVVELNGVTSEATHIYDPALSIWQSYGVLFMQWRIAFEIGAQNRDRGVRPPSVLAVLRILRDSRRVARNKL